MNCYKANITMNTTLVRKENRNIYGSISKKKKKPTNNLIGKRAEDMNRHFSKERYRMPTGI